MNCPVCSNGLTEVTAGDVQVDVCRQGCGGIWFDKGELEKFDEPHEHAGESLLDVERDPNISIDLEQRRNCPRCKDIVMMRHKFSVKRKVILDECAQCGGIWLDVGELATIRSLYNTEEERKQAAESYFKDFIAAGPPADVKAEEQKKLENARRLTNIMKYICPSYYIEGDQNWGAY